ncbi:DMT family transporter [Thermanaerovibrio acidaminovorans]|uniref:DMT family transporter n=1 Tax=Thermanaerovibrio acidaminovorans TaxID=81462 RepID=UPI00249382B4|nr:DMT family transporter [Thermanaerovibrio acidaminovorans]
MSGSKLKGVSLILLAGFLWGTMSPVGKFLAQAGTDTMTIVFSRALLAGLASALFMAWRAPHLLRLKPSQVPLICFYALFGVSAMYCGFFMALNFLSVALTEVIFFSYPILIVLLSPMVTGERAGGAEVLGATLILVAVVVAVLPSLPSGGAPLSLEGLGWAALSALGMTFYSLLARAAARGGRVPQGTLFVYGMLFGAVIMGTGKGISSGWGDLARLGLGQVGWILYLSLVATLVGYGAFYLGLRHVTAATAGVIGTVELVTAFALSRFVLGQPVGLNELAAGTLIILSISLVSLRKGSAGSAL